MVKSESGCLCDACMHASLVAQSCLTLCNPVGCSHQVPLSVGFSRQEYWSGLPFPTPRNVPDPQMEPASLVSPELAGRFFYHCVTWEHMFMFSK